MKVNQLILCVICWLTGSLVCQAQSISMFRFGVVGGINAGQINTPLVKSTTGLLWQYNVGVTVEQRFSSRFSLAYELKYARQGGTAKTSGLSGNDSNISEFNYLTLPIISRFQPRGERIFIEIGGQVGYFLSGRNYFASKKNQALSVQNMAKIDAGLVGGLGYRLGKHLVTDARYYYGMREIRRDLTAPDPTTGIPTLIKFVPQYNRVWSLNFSYYF